MLSHCTSLKTLCYLIIKLCHCFVYCLKYSRLLDFFKKFKIIHDNQLGFRKGRSTHMALMILIDKIAKSLENGEWVIGVFLDFSKAFDTVNHDVLLQKLQHYGIRGSALKWFQSYLSDRCQYVTYIGQESSKKAINCGVPQGSILGPLLFIIYVNDLSNVCNHMMSSFLQTILIFLWVGKM